MNFIIAYTLKTNNLNFQPQQTKKQISEIIKASTATDFLFLCNIHLILWWALKLFRGDSEKWSNFMTPLVLTNNVMTKCWFLNFDICLGMANIALDTLPYNWSKASQAVYIWGICSLFSVTEIDRAWLDKSTIMWN